MFFELRIADGHRGQKRVVNVETPPRRTIRLNLTLSVRSNACQDNLAGRLRSIIRIP
jgi:hypothetical protein